MDVDALLMRHSKPKAAFHKSMSGQTFRPNGPFCRESLSYPVMAKCKLTEITSADSQPLAA